MTKTTPWDEARRTAMDAAQDAYDECGERHSTNMDAAVIAALATLSRHGYRLVPAEATPQMVHACSEADSCVASYEDTINAATEAGDVLREGK